MHAYHTKITNCGALFATNILRKKIAVIYFSQDINGVSTAHRRVLFTLVGDKNEFRTAFLLDYLDLTSFGIIGGTHAWYCKVQWLCRRNIPGNQHWSYRSEWFISCSHTDRVASFATSLYTWNMPQAHIVPNVCYQSVLNYIRALLEDLH